MSTVQEPRTEAVIIHQNEHVTERKVQQAWQLFVSLEYQIQVADRKVQAIFSVNALVVAALSIQAQNSLSQLRHNGINAVDILSIVLRIVLLGFVCVATASALTALRPRIRHHLPQTDVQEKSLFFFGDIQRLSDTQFQDYFLHLSNEDSARQILRQVHKVSEILSEKYRWMNRAASALTGSLVIWIVLQVLRFVS